MLGKLLQLVVLPSPSVEVPKNWVFYLYIYINYFNIVDHDDLMIKYLGMKILEDIRMPKYYYY